METADTARARHLLEREFGWGLAYGGQRWTQQVLTAICDLAAGTPGADDRLRDAVLCEPGPKTRAWLREHGGNPGPEPTALRFLEDCRKAAATMAVN